MNEHIKNYNKKYDQFLQIIAKNLEKYFQDILDGVPRIDRVSARAKTPKSFAEKANREKDDGTLKYDAPLTQIQDQVGARVLVFYKDDVDSVVKIVNKYLRHIEEKEIEPESHWEFGYFGHHMILALPKDVIPAGVDVDEVPHFFELQVKTLFQHAWSEANHDLGYKPFNQLNSNQHRRLAFTAAQAWGADQVFQELWREVHYPER